MFFHKEDLLPAFQSIPEMVETYFKNIPDDLLDRKRNGDSWTIREHLYHIVSVQEMLYQRILKIRDEECPVITPFFPENEKDSGNLFQSIQEAFLCYKEKRERQIHLIKQLKDLDFQKEAVHGEYVSYNIPIIINHIIFHDYWHMYRIEELWLTKEEYFS